ncbi:hypothetical protein Ocin01_07058 [Orchesella cincta]|uniref:Uncharacterized protein n=1 Tax=Orchesella cincta TaxID=48709 RepID=A0A1D2N2Y9_ORCCI|nr:hypothetical protein Ocin01_07058 [Orchesella cincta]
MINPRKSMEGINQGEELLPVEKMPPTGQPLVSPFPQGMEEATQESEGGGASSWGTFSFEYPPTERWFSENFHEELSIVPYTEFEKGLPPAAVLPYEMEGATSGSTRKRQRTQAQAPTRKSLRRSKSSDAEQEPVVLNLTTPPLIGSMSALESFSESLSESSSALAPCSESLSASSSGGIQLGTLQYVWDAMTHLSDPYTVSILAGESQREIAPKCVKTRRSDRIAAACSKKTRRYNGKAIDGSNEKSVKKLRTGLPKVFAVADADSDMDNSWDTDTGS